MCASSLIRRPRSFGGAHVVTAPAYARTYAADLLSGKLPGLREDSLHAVVGLAPLRANGLVDPRDVLADLPGMSRLLVLYLSALRIPIFGLLRAPDCPKRLTIHVHLGVVGDAQQHKLKISRMGQALEHSSRNVYDRLFKSGELPPAELNFELHTTAPGALFDLADLFAHVGCQVAERKAVGGELVDAARAILSRLTTVNEAHHRVCRGSRSDGTSDRIVPRA